MNKWKSASEMKKMAEESIAARDKIIKETMLPHHIDEVIDHIAEVAKKGLFECTHTFYPSDGEENWFEYILIAIHDELISLGYTIDENSPSSCIFIIRW